MAWHIEAAAQLDRRVLLRSGIARNARHPRRRVIHLAAARPAEATKPRHSRTGALAYSRVRVFRPCPPRFPVVARGIEDFGGFLRRLLVGDALDQVGDSMPNTRIGGPGEALRTRNAPGSASSRNSNDDSPLFSPGDSNSSPTGTPSTAAIRDRRLAPIRFVPFSYFWTC